MDASFTLGALNSPVSPVQFTSSVQLMEFPRAEFEYVAMLSPSAFQLVCVNICDILVNRNNLQSFHQYKQDMIGQYAYPQHL